MNEVWFGIRGAVLTALGLSIVAFFTAPSDGTTQLGWKFAVIAFGFFFLPQVVLGVVVGLLGRAWKGVDDVDAILSSKRALIGSVCAVGVVVGAFHAGVSSSFVRTLFQAAALTIVFASVGFLLLLAFPIWERGEGNDTTGGRVTLFFCAVVWIALSTLVFGISQFVVSPSVVSSAIFASVAFGVGSFVGRRSVGIVDRVLVRFPRLEHRALSILIALIVAVGVLVVVAGSQLNVWSFATLVSFALIGCGTPLLYLLQQVAPLPGARLVAIAGAITAVICFGLGAVFSSENPDMRQLVTGQRTALAIHANALQGIADTDGDGYAAYFGGYDCDDSNPNAFPGAQETPGNGVDEDCSGADSEPIVREHHGIALVRRAVRTASAEVAKVDRKLPEPPKNIVFFIIDTLRFDHLGFAGYDRKTSPNIDKIAADSTVFARTYATSPHTPRSIPAMFLSRYASKTDWRGGQYNYPKIKPENVSFFELLEGYENVGITSHFYFQKKQGIQQGFTRWDNSGFGTIAESNVDIASPRIFKKLVPVIQELGKSDKPFSLFVHLFDPHAKWIGHKEFDFGKGETTEQKHMNNYDSEIAYVDQYVGRIVAQLKAQGIWDNSIVVLTSDHGEAFNEHGFFYHGQTLYNEVIHVPLLIRVPGWPARRVDTPTSIVDIAPTLAELVGVSAPEAFQGISLVPSMVGQPLPNRPVFAELLPYTSWKEHHRAVIDGDWKMIHVVSAGKKELYNLQEDPGEKTNVISKHPDKAKELSRQLERFKEM